MIARALLAPIHLAQLASGAKSFRDNPVIGSRWLNERGLHVARLRLAHALAARRRAGLAHLLSPEDRTAFDRDGFVSRPDFLPPAAFAAIRDGVLNGCFPAREMVQGDTVTRRFAVDPGLIAQVPALRALLDDPRWRGLTRYVGSFDAEPIVYVQSILSGMRRAAPDPQTAFHADTFHPTVKAWLFLTDVAADEGPFTYVPGSHRLTPARIEWERAMSLRAPHGVDRLSAKGSFRIAADELPALGLGAPRAFAVPANTLVVGDTFGFHARGPSVRPSTRVEIWGYGRRNPFLPWAGLDPLSVPGLAERRAGWNWRWRDTLQQLGVKGTAWADVGLKAPADRS